MIKYRHFSSSLSYYCKQGKTCLILLNLGIFLSKINLRDSIFSLRQSKSCVTEQLKNRYSCSSLKMRDFTYFFSSCNMLVHGRSLSTIYVQARVNEWRDFSPTKDLKGIGTFPSLGTVSFPFSPIPKNLRAIDLFPCTFV